MNTIMIKSMICKNAVDIIKKNTEVANTVLSSKIIDQWDSNALSVCSNTVKYERDLLSVVECADSWIEKHANFKAFVSIGWKRFLIDICGIPEEEYQKMPRQKATLFFSIQLAQGIEFLRFIKSDLEKQIDSYFEMFSECNLSKNDKKERTDKFFFFYDYWRNMIVEFMHSYGHSIVELSRNDASRYYSDKLGETVDLSYLENEIRCLVLPADLRIVKLYFEKYRLSLNRFFLQWGVFYSYQYLLYLFYSTCAGVVEGRHLDLFPKITYRNEEVPDIIHIGNALCDALSSVYDLAVQEQNDNDAIPLQLKTLVSIVSASLYSVDSYNVAQIPSFQNLQERIKSKIYFLAVSLPVCDNLIDYFVFARNNAKKSDLNFVDQLKRLESKIKGIRQKILTLTYETDSVYDDISEDKRLKYIQMKEDAIQSQMTICDSFTDLINSADSNNAETVLRKKKSVIDALNNMGKIPPFIVDKISSVMEKWTKRMIDDFSDNPSCILYLEKIKQQIPKMEMISDKDYNNFILMLSSAEFTYDTFINNKDENKNLDYSFVALLYYTSLENLISNHFYKTYIKRCFGNIKKESFTEDRFAECFNIKSLESLTRSVKEDKENGITYYKIVKDCELGKLSHIFTDDAPIELVNYWNSCFSHATIEDIKSFGEQLSKASNQRNKAAHGTSIILYSEAKEAKESTFHVSIEVIRGLIFDYLKMV